MGYELVTFAAGFFLGAIYFKIYSKPKWQYHYIVHGEQEEEALLNDHDQTKEQSAEKSRRLFD